MGCGHGGGVDVGRVCKVNGRLGDYGLEPAHVRGCYCWDDVEVDGRL